MTSRNSSLAKAVLLAAGKGTRMKDLTTELPKPMLPVGGIPVLERILLGLIASGIRQFLIITGYKSEVVRSYFGDGSRWNATITYQEQVVQDGTGRVLELARDFAAQDAFLLSYGDILVSPKSYLSIQHEWGRGKKDGILTVRLGEDIRKGAVAIFDSNWRLQELVEKPSDPEIQDLKARFGEFKPWYNAGIYVFTHRIFPYIARLEKSPRGEYELTDAIRKMAHDGLRLHGLPMDDYWVDVRDPEVLAEANRQIGRV